MTETTQPIIFLFLYREFDVRLMMNSQIFSLLIKMNKVVVVAPEELHQFIEQMLGHSISIEPLQYFNPKSEQAKTEQPKNLRHKIESSIINGIFRITYALPKGKEHLTRKLHIWTLKKTHRTGLKKWLMLFNLSISTMACMSMTFRFFLQKVTKIILLQGLHQHLFSKYNPSLVVTCSIGLGLDAKFIMEAQKNNVPTLSIVQSWDKTTSKGYPLATPDYVVAWSNIMADECEAYHDIPRERVFVAGIPLWDHYFHEKGTCTKESFCEQFALNPGQPIIYFAICSPAFHKGNLNVISLLMKWQEKGYFQKDVQLIFRMHPYYFDEKFNKVNHMQMELRELMDKYKNRKGFAINYPDVMTEGNMYMLSSTDGDVLRNLLQHSDVCISVMSTQMIEAAIFDRPAISVEFGHWKSNVIDADMKDYKLEHLGRIYEAKAIMRAASQEQLLDQINDALTNPERLKRKRAMLIDQEIPVNRGKAAQSVVRYITALSHKQHRKA